MTNEDIDTPTGSPGSSPTAATLASRAVLTSLLVGLAVLVLTVGLLAWRWPTLTHLWLTLDPGNALGACRDGEEGTRLFCDFANNYYPEGRIIFTSSDPKPGFFYPVSFALAMGWLARLSYEPALAIWVGIQVLVTLVLYLYPHWNLLPRSRSAAALFPLVFATSLPILHNFIWGQVSVLIAVLALGAFALHGRGLRVVPGILLGFATAIKIYPVLFAAHFLLKRDLRALASLLLTTAGLVFVIPAAILGIDDSLRFNAIIAKVLEVISTKLQASRYPNYIGNSVPVLLSGEVDPLSVLARVAGTAGYLLSAVNVVLLFLLVRRKVKHEVYWSATLLFTIVPMVVKTSWVHYFVFLPLVHVFLYVLVIRSRWPLWGKTSACAAFLFPSVMLTNIFFFERFHPDAYYGGGYVFLSVALLIPVMYLQAFSVLQRARRPDPSAPEPSPP